MGKFLHYGLNCINYGAFWGWGSGHFLHYPQKAPKSPMLPPPLRSNPRSRIVQYMIPMCCRTTHSSQNQDIMIYIYFLHLHNNYTDERYTDNGYVRSYFILAQIALTCTILMQHRLFWP